MKSKSRNKISENYDEMNLKQDKNTKYGRDSIKHGWKSSKQQSKITNSYQKNTKTVTSKKIQKQRFKCRCLYTVHLKVHQQRDEKDPQWLLNLKI